MLSKVPVLTFLSTLSFSILTSLLPSRQVQSCQIRQRDGSQPRPIDIAPQYEIQEAAVDVHAPPNRLPEQQLVRPKQEIRTLLPALAAQRAHLLDRHAQHRLALLNLPRLTVRPRRHPAIPFNHHRHHLQAGPGIQAPQRLPQHNQALLAEEEAAQQALAVAQQRVREAQVQLDAEHERQEDIAVGPEIGVARGGEALAVVRLVHQRPEAQDGALDAGREAVALEREAEQNVVHDGFAVGAHEDPLEAGHGAGGFGGVGVGVARVGGARAQDRVLDAGALVELVGEDGAGERGVVEGELLDVRRVVRVDQDVEALGDAVEVEELLETEVVADVEQDVVLAHDGLAHAEAEVLLAFLHPGHALVREDWAGWRGQIADVNVFRKLLWSCGFESIHDVVKRLLVIRIALFGSFHGRLAGLLVFYTTHLGVSGLLILVSLLSIFDVACILKQLAEG